MTFELPPAMRSALTSSPCLANRPASMPTCRGSSEAVSVAQAERIFTRGAEGGAAVEATLEAAAGPSAAGAGRLAGAAGDAQALANSADSTQRASLAFGPPVSTITPRTAP